MGDNPPTVQMGTAFTDVAPFYDALMAGVPYDYWADYIEQLFERHGVRPGTLLDIGCGTGALTIEMALRGYRCTGVDLSESMLALAVQNSALRAIAIDFIHQDAAELSIPGRRFNAAVSLFDSLNNLTEPGRLRAAFERARQQLTSPGIFVFDLNTEYAFTSGMFNQRSTPADGDLQYTWRSNYDRDSKICTIDMKFSFEPVGTDAKKFVETHVQRAYERGDITQWLTEAGFDGVWCYDAYTFKEPRRRSDRIFFVAGKGLATRPEYVNKVLAIRR